MPLDYSTSALVVIDICMFVRATWLLRNRTTVNWKGGKRLKSLNGYIIETSIQGRGKGSRVGFLRWPIWFDGPGKVFFIFAIYRGLEFEASSVIY